MYQYTYINIATISATNKSFFYVVPLNQCSLHSALANQCTQLGLLTYAASLRENGIVKGLRLASKATPVRHGETGNVKRCSQPGYGLRTT